MQISSQLFSPICKPIWSRRNIVYKVNTSRCSVRCFGILTDCLSFFWIMLSQSQVFDFYISFSFSKLEISLSGQLKHISINSWKSKSSNLVYPDSICSISRSSVKLNVVIVISMTPQINLIVSQSKSAREGLSSINRFASAFMYDITFICLTFCGLLGLVCRIQCSLSRLCNSLNEAWVSFLLYFFILWLDRWGDCWGGSVSAEVYLRSRSIRRSAFFLLHLQDSQGFYPRYFFAQWVFLRFWLRSQSPQHYLIQNLPLE